MKSLRKLAAALIGLSLAIAVFERVAPYRLIKLYWRFVNPLFASVAGFVPGLVLLETTGRRTGLPRRVLLGGRRTNGSVWVVAAHASKSAKVRNLRADPHVRVRVQGRWQTGVAHIVPDDDARRRAVQVSPLNGLFMNLASSDQLSIRIDLD